MAEIKAVVTLHNSTAGGGAPIFKVDNQQELEELSFLLEKILDASAHDLKNGIMILVEHH